ncbi:MAG TPA: YceI family protein [Vicinamibacterales bacterium]|jgi:polyisoprenoid-binding protein YceI
MSTAAATTPVTSTWKIDPAHSHVEFAVKHLMISTVRGRFAGVEGTVRLDDSTPAAAGVDVTIDVASIDTREPRRDEHLRSSDFFDAERFPRITFSAQRIADRHAETFKLPGDLTIHGVTRPIVLDVVGAGSVKDPWGGERRGFSATAAVRRSDFGLTWNQALEAGGVLVGDEVKILLELELLRG